MGRLETDMGGRGDAFPRTAWSAILAGEEDAATRRKRLNDLLTQYWRPVYKYIRCSWSKTIEDAKDLTQEFFCTILESDFVDRYQKEKGRFRYFLKGTLKHFLSSKQREDRAIKRGGAVVIQSLNVEEVENEEFLAETRHLSPEEIFDRQWAREVMNRSLGKVKKALLAEGKEKHFRIYEDYALRPAKDGKITYDDLADRHSVSVRDVENHLRHVRARLHDAVLDNMTEFVTSRDELLQEMNELFTN